MRTFNLVDKFSMALTGLCLVSAPYPFLGNTKMRLMVQPFSNTAADILFVVCCIKLRPELTWHEAPNVKVTGDPPRFSAERPC